MIVIGTLVGMASASLSLTFSLSTGIVKELLKKTRSEKKKYNNAAMLVRRKLNSIEDKTSEAIINNQIISHKDFTSNYKLGKKS